MSLDAPILKNNIRTSETEQTLKDQVESQLKLAEYILRWAKDKYTESSDIYKRIKTEQDELKNSIQSTLNDNNKTTQDEMLKLKLELWDILHIASEEGIHEKEWFFSNKWWDNITWVNRTQAENDTDDMLNKDISELKKSPQEAFIILNHLNTEYNDYQEWSTTLLDKSTLRDLKDKTEVEQFQEKLIDIILWNEDGFNNWKLKAYSENKWFYIISESNVTKIITKKIDVINNKLLIENFLLSITSNETIESDWIESKIISILWEEIGKEVILHWNEKWIIDTDWDWKSELIYDAINTFNESLDIDILKKLSWFLPDELNKIISQSTNWDQDKNKVLFRITQYIYSLSDSDFVKDYNLRSNFFEEAHNKVTENILRDVLNDWKQVVSFDNIKWYDVKETSVFEQEIQKNWAENMNKLEIASFLWNLDPNTKPQELVNKLWQDNVLYIMLLFKSWELINWFDKVKKVFVNFNENNIESFASEYLTSKYFQSTDWWELLNNNINKLSPTQKTTLLTIVETNSNICIKCEWGNFEDPITNEILSISKEREISEIYKEKQQEFNEKIVTEFLKRSWLTELPIDLKKQLERLWWEIFDQAKEVIKTEGCAFELIKFVHQHENIKEIEVLLWKYWLDVDKFKELQKSLTETVTSTNTAVNLKHLENKVNSIEYIRKLAEEYPDNHEFQTQLEEDEKQLIIIQQKVVESKRIEKITKVADTKDIEKIIEKLDQWYNREEIINYLVENSENWEKFKEAILEYKNDITAIEEWTYQEKLNEINNIDKKSTKNDLYQDYTIDNNWEWSFINLEWTEEKIKITEEEAEIVEDNPEWLKNLIHMKEKLEELNLWFMWTFRQELISLSWEILWTNWINNSDKNFIDKNELNKLLNMILNIAWYSWDAWSISWTYAKVILLNWVGSLNNKKDTNTWLSNIWMIFKSDKVWFLNNKDSLQTNWKSNVLKNYKH